MQEIQSSSINLNGVDIRTIDRQELRCSMTVVGQEPLLLHGLTVHENLLLGHGMDGTGEDNIWAVWDQAGLKTVITDLPDRLNTLMEDAGLSNGQ